MHFRIFKKLVSLLKKLVGRIIHFQDTFPAETQATAKRSMSICSVLSTSLSTLSQKILKTVDISHFLYLSLFTVLLTIIKT